MAMEQIGFVAEIDGSVAKVRVDRESACGGNCAGCHGCPQSAVLVSCPLEPGASIQVGDKVKVLMPTKKFFSGIFQSYGVLILTVFLGAAIGYCLGKSEGFSVLGALVGLFLGGSWVHIISRKTKTIITIEKITP